MVIWALTYTNGCYDARTRFVIRQVTWKMRIPYEDMECIEEIVIEKLFESSKKESPYVCWYFVNKTCFALD